MWFKLPFFGFMGTLGATLQGTDGMAVDSHPVVEVVVFSPCVCLGGLSMR